MKTLIVVDGENAFSSNLKQKINTMENTDSIVVTGKNQKNIKIDSTNIQLVNVDCDYKNAVDFVVVSVVSSKIATKKYKNTIIISGDNDYESAIKYLRSLGHKVCRVSHKEFMRNKKDAENQLQSLVRTFCGYIKNNVENGMSQEEFKAKEKQILGKSANTVNGYLVKNSIINYDKGKIYFNKNRLDRIAKGKNLTIGGREESYG